MIYSVKKPSTQGQAATYINKFWCLSDKWTRANYNACGLFTAYTRLKTDSWWNAMTLYLVKLWGNENERA